MTASPDSYGVMFREGAEPVVEPEIVRHENGWCSPSLDLQNVRDTILMQGSVRRGNVRRAEKLGVAILKCECGSESDEKAIGWEMLASGRMLCPLCAATDVCR